MSRYQQNMNITLDQWMIPMQVKCKLTKLYRKKKMDASQKLWEGFTKELAKPYNENNYSIELYEQKCRDVDMPHYEDKKYKEHTFF